MNKIKINYNYSRYFLVKLSLNLIVFKLDLLSISLKCKICNHQEAAVTEVHWREENQIPLIRVSIVNYVSNVTEIA